MDPDFVFQSMMEVIVINDFEQAKISAISDMNKISDNSLSNMLIMNANTDIELIKIMAGFSVMSEKVKQYYTNPEKAISDYRK